MFPGHFCLLNPLSDRVFFMPDSPILVDKKGEAGVLKVRGWQLGTLGALVLGLAACQGNVREQGQRMQSGAETVQVQGQKRAEANSVRGAGMRYQEALSQSLRSVEGVQEAVVLLDGSYNAYVALRTDLDLAHHYVKAPLGANDNPHVKVHGQLPMPIQGKLAALLRKGEPRIRTVHLTNDPAQFDKLARRSGVRLQGMQTSPDEEIRQIWRD
jgi:hypothetical protein